MKRILIADDSATMRRMIRASLHALAGIGFEEASSGLEVLERLALVPVDLILLDLNMPDMHGLEVLHFLRQHRAYRSIPTIVLTTRDDEASRQAAVAAGANAYVTKPFEPRALAEHARALLDEIDGR